MNASVLVLLAGLAHSAPVLDISDTCPGDGSVLLTGATPDGQVLFAKAAGAGTWVEIS